MELILILVKSLLLTILLEAGGAVLSRITDKKDLLLIGMVNLLTNPPVVLIAYLGRSVLTGNLWILKAVLELIAVCAEGWYYKRYGKTIRHPWLLSIVLNGISYGCGTLIH